MSVFFANPWGFLALLGVPVLFAIYFFQRQTRVYQAPTLFMLKSQFEHQTGGAQMRRFQPAWSLLLQLLALLLLTLLLVQPRVRQSDAVLPVALVMDSSASMLAYKQRALAAVDEVLAKTGQDSLSLQVFESAPESAILYSGTDLAEAKQALANWLPMHGVIDPAATLALARSRVGVDGLVVYISDHEIEGVLPARAQAVAIGVPLDNVGICGVSVKQRAGQPVAQFLVKNYSAFQQDRGYRVQLPSGEELVAKTLQLAPRQAKTISYPLSSEVSQICLVLERDSFTLDDVAPVLLPTGKPMSLGYSTPKSEIAALTQRLAKMLGAPGPVIGGSPDLVMQVQRPDDLRFPRGHSVTFIESRPNVRLQAHTDPLIPVQTELTKDLVWDTLIVPQGPSFVPSAQDEVILWVGQSPLISIRETQHAGNRYKHLVCNFPLEGSNAETQANIGLLLYRFAEQVRELQPAPFSALAEVNQSLPSLVTPSAVTAESPLVVETTMAHDAGRVEISDGSVLNSFRLPALPNIVRLSQGDQEVATLATYFADTREADFSRANTVPLPALDTQEAMLLTTKPLPYSFLLLLALLILSLGVWMLTAPKTPKEASPVIPT